MKNYDIEGRLVRLREDFRGKLIVAGDIHGDLGAFDRVKKFFSREPGSILIFLGDYADRGENGLEVIEGVQGLLRDHPNRVIALKGNHEDYFSPTGAPDFSPCDLPAEVESKKNLPWGEFFPRLERDFLDKLHLAVLVPKVALCLHGGVSSKLRKIEDLRNPDRSLEMDILWSDPVEPLGEHTNPRGAGTLFGPDVSSSVLEKLGVKFLIRGHEPQKAFDGPFVEHGGRVITNGSTRVYGRSAFVLNFKPYGENTSKEIQKSFINLFDE